MLQRSLEEGKKNKVRVEIGHKQCPAGATLGTGAFQHLPQ